MHPGHTLTTGGVDNSAAFRDNYDNVAGNRVPAGLFSTATGGRVVDLPAGVFKVTDSEAFMRDLGIDRTRGLVFRGAGKFLTIIDFQPSAADARLLFNNDDWLHVSFEGITFNCSGANAATATFMASHSTGGAQNYKFDQCTWSGTWKRGLDLAGSNTNSECTWSNCGITGTWGDFLHVADVGTSDQFVNYNFFATDFEVSTGSLVTMGRGGNINVWGGSLIHINPTATTSFFNLRQPSHAYGVMRLLVVGARIEHRNQYSRTIYSEWGDGTITFLSCDESVNAAPGATDNYDTATYAFGNSNGPNVQYIGCELLGRHTYTSAVNGWEGAHSVTYDGCNLTDHVDAATFIVTSTVSNSGGLVPVRFRNCRSRRGVTYVRPLDCNINWRNQIRGQPEQMMVTVKAPNGGSIIAGESATVVLPVDSVVTRVFMVKPAEGSSGFTTWAYTLTDGDSNVVATLTAGGTAWSGAWSRESGPLFHQCSTTNRRTLTLSATNCDQRSNGGAYVIEYIA
jgi:hypothetical protein